jgi:hypothetical protein
MEKEILPDVILDDKKLILSTEALNTLSITSGARISIKYIMRDGNMVPVIGTSQMFGDDEGNLLTKSQTVSFRGEQNKLLQLYGKKFKIEKFLSYFCLVNFETGNLNISLDIINQNK